jgi:diacylglycerol kinase (ATP)
MERLWLAAINSWKGFAFAARTERAFQEEIVVLVLAVPAAFWLAESVVQRFVLIGSVLFLMVVELLNTAIEKLADRVSREIDGQIGTVKDIGSAAVGLSLLLAGAVWLLALGQRFGLL